MASTSTRIPESHLPFFTSKPSNISHLNILEYPFPRIQTLTFPRIFCGKLQNPRVLSVPAARARARPRSSVLPESDELFSYIRKQAMEVIVASGGRVTVGDVVMKSGLSLTEAQKALQAIAFETNGFLEVSDKGDILYAFPKYFRPKPGAKSSRTPWLVKAKAGANYLKKVSFGTALIASTIVVYSAIIILSTKRNKRL